MPETDYLKIPQNRVGALIGSNGNVKKSIEKATGTILDIDSDEGTVYITPREDMEDPLGVWNANHIVKAVARGFNPEVALKVKNISKETTIKAFTFEVKCYDAYGTLLKAYNYYLYIRLY